MARFAGPMPENAPLSSSIELNLESLRAEHADACAFAPEIEPGLDPPAWAWAEPAFGPALAMRCSPASGAAPRDGHVHARSTTVGIELTTRCWLQMPLGRAFPQAIGLQKSLSQPSLMSSTGHEAAVGWTIERLSFPTPSSIALWAFASRA